MGGFWYYHLYYGHNGLSLSAALHNPGEQGLGSANVIRSTSEKRSHSDGNEEDGCGGELEPLPPRVWEGRSWSSDSR